MWMNYIKRQSVIVHAHTHMCVAWVYSKPNWQCQKQSTERRQVKNIGALSRYNLELLQGKFGENFKIWHVSEKNLHQCGNFFEQIENEKQWNTCLALIPWMSCSISRMIPRTAAHSQDIILTASWELFWVLCWFDKNNFQNKEINPLSSMNIGIWQITESELFSVAIWGF